MRGDDCISVYDVPIHRSETADMTGVGGLLESGEMGAVRGEPIRPRVLVKSYSYGVRIATLLVKVRSWIIRES